MKRFILIMLLGFGFSVWTACKDQHKEGGHSHDTDEHVKENHSHEVENPLTTTLTQEQINTVGIEYGKIEQKALTATLKINGVLRVPNKNKGIITAMYGGLVKNIKVEMGNPVRKGQVIATIANPEFAQMQEEYLTNNSKILLAEQELERQKKLNKGNAGVRKNLEFAEAELKTLKTVKASLYKQLQLININPDNLSNENIRGEIALMSPIDGTVSNVYAKTGSFVDIATPIAEVIDNSALHMDLQVFEKDLPLIKEGQKITFTLTNNPSSTYEASVFSIGSSFINESKSVAVHCELIGSTKGLIDGMNVTGIVSLDDVLSPAVPDQAIVEADGKYYVFVVEKEQPDSTVFSFTKTEVVKGVSHLGYTAVSPLREIPENTSIVTRGAFFVNAKLSNTGAHKH